MTNEYYRAGKWLLGLSLWKQQIIEEYYLTSKHSKSVAEIREAVKKEESKLWGNVKEYKEYKEIP